MHAGKCAHLLDPGRCWKSRWYLWAGGTWGSCSQAEKFPSSSSLPPQSPAVPPRVASRTPMALIPNCQRRLGQRVFIYLSPAPRGTDGRCPGAGAAAPRSLLDPADGLDLARLRVGPPLPHVLVLARGAVALQEVLEAPVPRVLRADPPATEQRAAVARGWRHRGRVPAAAGASSARLRAPAVPAGCKPRYSRSGADKEGAHGAAAPAQGGQRGAVVAHLCPLALEVLLLKEHQPAPSVVLRPRRARLWHCHLVRGQVGSGGRPAGRAGAGALTAQAMGRKEHILSTW